jgi:hypothetical protein
MLCVGLGVLNQDFQDFEDFLVLGAVWEGACRSIKLMKISAILSAAATIAATKFCSNGTHFHYPPN